MLSETFRSPESYNTLMYAITTGKHRISEIAAFAGFANNKCDKYIKSLKEAGLVKAVQVKDHNQKLYTNYILSNTYLELWYKWIYPNRNQLLLGFSDVTLSEISQYIDNVLVPKMFRKSAFQYLNHRGLFHFTKQTDNSNYYDIVIDNVHFDFVQPAYNGHLFVKIVPEFGHKFTEKDWRHIVQASSKLSPFYHNYYVLFQNSRFSDFFWNQSHDIDDLKIIQPEWLRF